MVLTLTRQPPIRVKIANGFPVRIFIAVHESRLNLTIAVQPFRLPDKAVCHQL